LGADVAEAMPDSAFTAKAQFAPKQMNTAVKSSDISLVFKLGETSAPYSVQSRLSIQYWTGWSSERDLAVA